MTHLDSPRRFRWLPAAGSPAYHLMLAAVAVLILGPLGGISAAFMNFSLGFFVGGQVLAGILGSAVTFGYGPEGKHGANYMQTMAASVASMAGMGVLIQAMVWLGLPEPPAWQLILYFACIGMFGVGVGMLCTPIVVDRMQLTFPSGLAVANILRALTDKNLLRRSVAKLGGGILAGFCGGVAAMKVSMIEALGVSTATLGAGMVVGARIAVPGLVVGLIGWGLTPWLRTLGWLGEKDPFRKIGFILALGTILGAALVDIVLIAIQAVRRFQESRGSPAPPAEDWKRVNMVGLVAWVLFWGTSVAVVACGLFHLPFLFVGVSIALVFVFILVNGISLGISDWNPISSAFVMSVFLMAGLGLRDAGTGLMCAAILLIACCVGGDMQQDRSTGWRLGTNRVNQFRYQVLGILMGAVLAVVLARTFLSAYPVLRVDTFTHPGTPGVEQWQSAMTYKFVGALKGITDPKPHVMLALKLGLLIGLATEILRKLIKHSRRYQDFVKGGRLGFTTDFVLDAVVLPSPYASSFGGFVEVATTGWFAAGGVIGSGYETIARRKSASGEVPADMSTTSLVGGGLIAGDALAALTIGILGLLKALL
jgi:uncharacterized oligopeptide transporter (OPT) family protein